jgi:hypothetical protein
VLVAPKSGGLTLIATLGSKLYSVGFEFIPDEYKLIKTDFPLLLRNEMVVFSLRIICPNEDR